MIYSNIPKIPTLLTAAGLAVVLVLGFALNPTPAFAHHCKGKHKGDIDCNPPDDDGGKGTARVTISGPMETRIGHSFGLDKDSKRTLELNSWTGDVRGAPVEISYTFSEETLASCKCMAGNSWDENTASDCADPLDLKGHLTDSAVVSEYPSRWWVVIRVDTSELKTIGDSSITNSKGGHSIAITTDPDQTSTITQTTETLWIPEGPNKSGSVKVTLRGDETTESTRTRRFEFTDFIIQVVSNPGRNEVRQIMRCENKGDPVLKETLFGSSRPTTGLRLEPVPDGGRGVRVRSVTPGSLAEQAGLRAEDVVLAVDGERFDDLEDPREALQMMMRVIGHADAGTSVRIEYLRGGEINVTDTRTQTSAEIARLRNSMLKDRNTGNSANQRQAARERNRRRSSVLDGGAVSHWSELTLANMTPELGQYFGAETGVLLVHCSDKGLPLMEGDVILKIGQQVPADASQAVKLLQGYDPDEVVALEIWRHGRSFLLEFDFNTPPLPDAQVAQDSR